MHASSLENLQLCIDRYLEDAFFSESSRRVADIGSADINGSYRQLFREFPCQYVGFDLEPGPGVDVVLNSPYQIPLPDGSVDVVISGQTFEHCEFFWDSFKEMVRILSPTGYVFLIAPSAGPIHRYPVDCYRFYPDAYIALAKYANCHAVEIWRDERGPWQDLVGVFSKDPTAGRRADARSRIRTQSNDIFFDQSDVEPMSGAMSCREVLRTTHEAGRPRSYLEIGVRRGGSLSLAHCPAAGVDPDPDLSIPLGETVRLFQMTSDEFFASEANAALTEPPDLTFIDGMHLFEFALRDFMNIERRSHPASIVVIDDIFPNHPKQASRERLTRVWAGDVWKLGDCLRRYRPDLHLVPLDAAPAGLLIVLGLDPANRVLWDQYNPIVAAYRAPQFAEPPEQVIRRVGALRPAGGPLAELIASVAAARGMPKVSRLVDAAVRRFLATMPSSVQAQ